MADDARLAELRQQLAEAVPEWVGLCDEEPITLADALLPVVEAYAAQESGCDETCTTPLPPQDALASLIAFLQERRAASLRAIRARDTATTDYWRWQGHAELARQLRPRRCPDTRRRGEAVNELPAIDEAVPCTRCGDPMVPDRARWWTGYGCVCSEGCARDLIRDHEGGILLDEDGSR